MVQHILALSALNRAETKLFLSKQGKVAFECACLVFHSCRGILSRKEEEFKQKTKQLNKIIKSQNPPKNSLLKSMPRKSKKITKSQKKHKN